jgi:hypothetical protein
VPSQTVAISARHDDSKPSDPDAFVPSTRMQRYLAACLDPSLLTLEAIASAARINRVTVWKWKQDPAFVDWMTNQIQRTYGLKYSIALDRALNLAMQGSPEHLKLLMAKFGDLRSLEHDGSSNQRQQIAVHINVPRPQLEAPRREPDDVPLTIDVTPRPMSPPPNESEH